MRAWIDDQRARRETAEPTQMAKRFRMRAWTKLSRGRIARVRTETTGTRYPDVVK